MSDSTYITGFCKRASAAGVDPQELARFVLLKEAQDPGTSGSVMDSLKKWLDEAKKWYGQQDASTKALINAGGGALLGGAIGGIVGGGKGTAIGALLGGGAGAASQIDWTKIFNSSKPKYTHSQLSEFRNRGREMAQEYPL